MSETDVLVGGGVAEEAAHAGRDAARPAPDRCYACAAPVRGPYCYACGQRNDDCRRSLLSLFGETIRDVTSLDGRFARTLRAVVTRPGRYVRAYGDGVRSPYSPPIRFFLVVSFLFFTTLWVTDRQILVLQPKVEMEGGGELNLASFHGGFFVKADEVRYSAEERAALRAAMTGEGGTGVLRHTLLEADVERVIAEIEAAAEEEATRILRDGGEGAEAEARAVRAEAAVEIAEIRTAMADAADPLGAGPGPANEFLLGVVEGFGETSAGTAHASGGDAAEGEAAEGEALGDEPSSLTINGKEMDSDRLIDAFFRIAENPRLFNNALDDWIPRIMVLMVPLMALLGAVFVRGEDALLYDHGLLALNTHAMAFLLMTLGLWTAGFLPSWIFSTAVLLGVPIYYARGLRGAFGRSRRKTIVATWFVFTVYGLVLVSALTAAAVSAFADIA